MGRVPCQNPDCDNMTGEAQLDDDLTLCSVCWHDNVAADLRDELEEEDDVQPEEPDETTETESLTLGEFA